MDGLELWSKGRVLTQGCSSAVGYHESRIQTAFGHQEGRQLAEGGIAESFDSSFTNCGKFMDTNGQIVQGLKECLNRVGLYWDMGFPDGASGKEPACQCRRHERCRFDPWVGKIPWKRAWQPTPVFLPGEAHGQRSLVVYHP